MRSDLISPIAAGVGHTGRMSSPVLAPARELTAVADQAHVDPGEYVVSLYLSSLRSDQSRSSMSASLKAVADVILAASDVGYDPARVSGHLIDWVRLDWGSCTSIKTLMRERGWAPATMNRHLAAVRGVVKVCQLVGLMESDRAERCRAALSGEPRAHDGADPAGRLITHVELRTMFDVLAQDESAIARRDAAAVAILAMGGLRRSELVALDLVDWRDESGELIIRSGKGGRSRKVWLHGGARHGLEAWLEVRGTDDGPLLLAVRRGGQIVTGEEGRVSPHAVWKRVKALAARAGVADLAPHDFRRKVITDLLDQGVDLSAAQQLAGHRSISTTATYDRRGERAAKRASAMLEVPYIGPACRNWA